MQPVCCFGANTDRMPNLVKDALSEHMDDCQNQYDMVIDAGVGINEALKQISEQCARGAADLIRNYKSPMSVDTTAWCHHHKLQCHVFPTETKYINKGPKRAPGDELMNIIVGGFDCGPWSYMNRSKNKRGVLNRPKFFAFVQFMLEIDIMEPDFIILENTPRWYYM